MATRETTRTRLLDAADHLLFTRGIAHTPVDAILERAGVSPATLYRAYASKEDLLAAALERRHAAWLEVWDDAVARAAGDRARLLAVLDALDDFQARPDGARWCAFLGTAAEVADPPPVLAAAVRRDTTALRARLRELAAPVSPERSAELAEALLLVVTGRLAMRLRDGDGPGAAGTARAVAGALVGQYASSA